MLTKPLSILILFSLFIANCSSLLVFLSFEANHAYISKELCVNKNKPDLHCNGKCYLMKKLKQAQDKEDKQERGSQKIQLQEALIVRPLVIVSYSYPASKVYVPTCMGILQQTKRSIFHPPQVIVDFPA